MSKEPKSGVIIYTSRSGQQYPSFFDEKNDYDLAESPSGDFRIIEINNYTTSAFYACDVKEIVKAIVNE